MPFRSPLLNIPRDLAKTVGGVVKFSGRVPRTQVWTYLIIGNFLAALIAGGLAILLGEAETFGPTASGSLVTLAFLAPLPALMVRRLHDIGRSSWLIVPILAGMVFAILTGGAQPKLVWVDKPLSGWMPTVVVVCGILLQLAVSLLPPRKEGDAYAPDPRLQRG